MADEACREAVYSDEWYDLILRNEDRLPQDAVEACVQQMDGDYQIWYVKRTELPETGFGTYTYSAVPKCFTTLSERALDASGILAVREQPNLNLTGAGVLIGLVDSGIDYTAAAFRYEDGTSRILSIWDQTEADGTPPEGFLFGQEYTKTQLDEALRAEQPLRIVPENDTDGHGTVVAAIAAGSADPRASFSGAAPFSYLAVVRLKETKQYLRDFYHIPQTAPAYQENDIMLGIDYLNRLATARGLPLVLIVALGTNSGSHGGDSYLEQYLDDIGQRRRRVAVVASGNEANARHHYYGKIRDAEAYETVELSVEQRMRGFCMEMWSLEPELYEIAVISPSGERLSRIPAERAGQRVYRFVLEGTYLTVDYRIVGNRSARQLIFLRFTQPSAGVWRILVYPSNVTFGIFHMWLPVREFLESPVYFLSSSPDVTLTVPATARLPVTVAGYNDENGALYLNSGRGYTTDGTIKPELAAPAVEVEGVSGNFTTGTSAAAAITAGACAMLLEWAVVRGNIPAANTADIKGELIRGAQQSPALLYPNREWGYGRLELSQTFLQLAGLTE